MDHSEITAHLLKAPKEHLDPQMLPLIEKWSNPPTALQVLEVLDHCIFSSLASDFGVMVLRTIYNMALKRESTTHEEIVKHATWRDKNG